MPSWQSYLIKPAIRLLRTRHSIDEQTIAEQRARPDLICACVGNRGEELKLYLPFEQTGWRC
jgi:hypothetical protein